MLVLQILPPLLWLGQIFASPYTLAPFVLHEKRTHTPKGWSHERKHLASAVLPLRFGLKQANIDKLEDYLYDISDPSSPNFGKHWTPMKVANTFAPSTESVAAVHEWLSDNGIAKERLRVTPGKNWIQLDATVEEAERLLLADYHVYRHESGQEHIACDEYYLPEQVAPHIDIVTPSVHFDTVVHLQPMSLDTTILKSDITIVNETYPGVDHCDTQISLDCLRALYNFDYIPTASDLNSYGIVEYTPQTFRQSDLDLFFTNYSIPELVGRPPFPVSIDGGLQQTFNQSVPFIAESHLDLQYGMGLVTPKLNVTLYQVGDTVNPNTSFNNFLDAMDGSYCTYEGGDDPSVDAIYPDTQPGGYDAPPNCGTAKPASVISTSYSYNEADLTPFYVTRQCNEYAKLGLMGITILYSSGDYGVAGNDGDCLNEDGSQTSNGTLFNPTFPGTCPYVTSVGATQVAVGNTVLDPEIAAVRVTSSSVFYSGGGFSNVFEIPRYQKNAVDAYLKNFRTENFAPAVYNSSGTSRAYPDVSANGANFVVAADGEFILEWGTSASTPTTGAILAMINDARLAAGKGTIGFINPTIYSASFREAFNDIKIGSNPGCGTDGFNAAYGWDPVTGLGTPNFEKLRKLWLALP
ncbi:peptidase S8/S53 domain-containing protein [Rhodocollybia butyracea]|uniref:tripeptidyl-peptidase II n=1 Tax=Rhodocollybia butyracea TaxID=206335 RepID=A0A9P5PSJ0_9AGAR|nr:peptidase S8/S53 domain-containing protein [Rhodocollybia butyracea]